MSTKLKREISLLNKAILGGNCPVLAFVENRQGFLCWKDVPQHVRDSIREHRIALATIHLKPGEWKQDAYDNLSSEEKDILHNAFRIIEKIEIKEGEELDWPSIH